MPVCNSSALITAGEAVKGWAARHDASDQSRQEIRGYFAASYIGNWDISPDGKRFLLLKPPESAGQASAAAGPRKINIILNWFEELKQRVSAK
jgi:hypothetical protein